MQAREEKGLTAGSGPGEQAGVQNEDRNYRASGARGLKSSIVCQAQVPANPPD